MNLGHSISALLYEALNDGCPHHSKSPPEIFVYIQYIEDFNSNIVDKKEKNIAKNEKKGAMGKLKDIVRKAVNCCIE